MIIFYRPQGTISMLDLSAFTIPADDVDLSSLDEQQGTYAVLLRAGTDCPEAGAIPLAAHDPGERSRVLYVGATKDCLHRRIKSHIKGDSRVSTFRRSLGLLLTDRLGLKVIPMPPKRYFCFTDEDMLSAWLRANTFVAFKANEEPFEVERRLLDKGGGALNLAGVGDTPVRARLRSMHREASGRATR